MLLNLVSYKMFINIYNKMAETSIKDKDKYKDTLQNLNSKAKVLLNQYVNRYPPYMTYPSYTEYENLYVQTKTELDKNNADLNKLKITVENLIEGGNDDVNNYNEDITELEKENASFKKKIIFLENSDSAAVGLNIEFENIYKIDLMYTVGLGAVIIFLGYLTGKTLNEKHINLKEKIGSILK
jgi:hypothetical protein